MSTFMRRVVNPIIQRLLQSRLHGIVSQRLLLITVTGRKSGAVYRIPVAYIHNGHELLVATHRSRHWWKNLADATTPVTLLIQGQTVVGTAEVLEDEGTVAAILWQHHQLASPRPLTWEKAASLAPGLVVIRIQLNSAKDAQLWTSVRHTSV